MKLKVKIRRHNAVHGHALEGRYEEIEKRIAQKEAREMPTDDRPLAKDEVECRKCQARYMPSFSRDYYGGENGRGGLCENCMMAEAFAKPDPVDVPDESHLNNVCRPGKGHETCRYLSMLSDVFSCVKGSNFQSAIDERAAEMGAQGDNCSGPPNFQPSLPISCE